MPGIALILTFNYKHEYFIRGLLSSSCLLPMGAKNGVDSDSLNIQNLDEVVLIDSRFVKRLSLVNR